MGERKKTIHVVQRFKQRLIGPFCQPIGRLIDASDRVDDPDLVSNGDPAAGPVESLKRDGWLVFFRRVGQLPCGKFSLHQCRGQVVFVYMLALGDIYHGITDGQTKFDNRLTSGNIALGIFVTGRNCLRYLEAIDLGPCR